MIIAYILGIHDNLSLEIFQEKHKILRELNQKSPVLFPFIFCSTLFVCTALSLPVNLVLSLLGGYLFPQPWSTVYVISASTLGACVIFLATRKAFPDLFKKRVNHFIQKMERGFHHHPVNYLFFLRLVPLVPFWVINIVPAFFHIRLWTFTWTTAIGSIPGTLVSTLAGRGIDEVLESGQEVTIFSFFNLPIVSASILVCLIFLLSIWLKKDKKETFHD